MASSLVQHRSPSETAGFQNTGGPRTGEGYEKFGIPCPSSPSLKALGRRPFCGEAKRPPGVVWLEEQSDVVPSEWFFVVRRKRATWTLI
ncbi:hypothetical protein TNIN_254971 [Trichonephila inaurata madagascariensis]|uniref:Uncharacterized protein n=1 Tax=Trichonephila inaurata madagascariensis TaxID=2747483 RepID=A0A8X6YHT5_9ARAC|nr:hypothetical protein TNIN_254971 [Trichonephila inaurata madagascariensis]